MKSKVLIVPLIAIMLLMTSTMAFAVTELDVDWDGAGGFSVDFDADDDAWMGFSTGGYYISGELHATLGDVNHYSYGVYDFTTNVDAYVEDGFIQYGVDRLDSGPYGPADQTTYSYIGASDWATLTFRTRTNYADLDSSNYGFQANDQFQAEGVYYAYHDVDNGLNNAYFEAAGDGILDIDHMTDDTWTTGIKFGKGCGCYTNADVTQTGSGYFELGAHFENSFTMGGMTASGPVNYLQSISFSNGFSWSDYSFSGN